MVSDKQFPLPTLADSARVLGSKGGTMTAKLMTPAQRSARGKKGAAARWAKRTKVQKENTNDTSR